MENKDKQNEYPKVIVRAIIANQEGKIMLARGKKWKNKFTVIGGTVEIGETLEAGLKREIKEEANINVDVVKQLSTTESIFSEDYSKNKHLIFVNYWCKFDGDVEDIRLNDEHEGFAEWLTPEEALKEDLSEGTRGLIEKYVKNLEEEDYLTGWKRCQADFDNYRKVQAERQKEYIEFANRNLIEEVLPVIDNFQSSLAHVPEGQETDPWVTGLTYIQKQLEKVMEDHGVSKIVVEAGDDFDESIHEAVKKEGDEEGNKIKEILQKGYKIGDKIIRPAKVVVN